MEDEKKEKSLVEAAIEQGAVIDDYKMESRKSKTVKEALGDGKVHFHEDLTKVEFAGLVGREFIIRDMRIVDGWDSVFGTSTFALLEIMFPDGSRATTLAGGRAVINQCRKLQNKRAFPTKVKVTKKQSAGGGGEYYLFE